MEPPREWEYKALPTGPKRTGNRKITKSNTSAERKCNFCQIRRSKHEKRKKMIQNIRQTFNIEKMTRTGEETQLAYTI